MRVRELGTLRERYEREREAERGAERRGAARGAERTGAEREPPLRPDDRAPPRRWANASSAIRRKVRGMAIQAAATLLIRRRSIGWLMSPT